MTDGNQFIISSATKRLDNRIELGGKAKNLFQLSQAGFNVPSFICIAASVFELFESQFDPTRDIHACIDSFSFPDDFRQQVSQKLPWGFDFYAVRSSANAEDGTLKSYAGQFETVLFVPESEIFDALKRVWLSAFNERTQVYEGLDKPNQKANISIIIQGMIDAEQSGVAFTHDPISGQEEFVINAVHGLGEGLVSGTLDADFYRISTQHSELQLGGQLQVLTFNENQQKGTQYVDIQEELKNTPVLNEAQREELCQALERIKNHYRSPQDVEFCFASGQLFILQARPITTISQEPLTIWDNSNIIESYPGLTSPLTFSFILKMYKAVYMQMAKIMGIREKLIHENEDFFSNMLGLLWGRVYYNLNNWHNTLSLLPGYELNSEFMDKMMGVKEKFPAQKKAKKQRKLTQYLDIVRAIFSVIRTHNRIENERVKFLNHFHGVLKEYEHFDFTQMGLQTLQEKYEAFEYNLSNNWRAPLVNDFFCMVYHGILQKVCLNWIGKEHEDLHNNLLVGAKDIITTQPIHLTEEILIAIRNNTEALALFRSEDSRTILASLENEKYKDIAQLIQRFLKDWGARCVGELKLETTTYEQAPASYIQILKSYLRDDQQAQFRTSNVLETTRIDAEELSFKTLKNRWFKKRLFKYLLNKTRYLVSNRENLRYERTKGFAMVRKMMLAFGEKFTKLGLIEEQKDIFWLAQNEIFAYVQGTSPSTKFKDLIALRKKEYQEFEKMDLPERISARGSVYLHNQFSKTTHDPSSGLVLNGTPCCPGIIEGKAVVLHSPAQIDEINNDILVTSSTDPGWVVLFPKATAIVVERGSLLSHSAIVSREMGIPCIVGVKGLLNTLKTGDRIRINGSTGLIEILERA